MRADLDLVEAVEDVELGERNPVDAGSPDALSHQNGVEPTAPARPPRTVAEFIAALADPAADVVVELGGEGPPPTRGAV